MSDYRCPYCAQLFQPSRFHPDQIVCGNPDCQRHRRRPAILIIPASTGRATLSPSSATDKLSANGTGETACKIL
ncbi:MAG TPA: hypothetical protein VG204_19185 [Terriglobia bacterium]|nr:hypothetical protein [Terriglobia bacterium]